MTLMNSELTRRHALQLTLAVPAAAQTAATDVPVVRWTPVPLFVGAPVLFRSKESLGVATWLDKKIEFRPDGNGRFSALPGVGLDSAPGKYPLIWDGHTLEVPVVAHRYPSS